MSMKVERVAAGIEELEILLVQIGLIHGFVGTEALVELGAGGDVLEFDLVVGAALAGLDLLLSSPRSTSALDIDQRAGADLVAGDLGHRKGSRKRVDGFPVQDRRSSPDGKGQPSEKAGICQNSQTVRFGFVGSSLNHSMRTLRYNSWRVWCWFGLFKQPQVVF